MGGKIREKKIIVQKTPFFWLKNTVYFLNFSRFKKVKCTQKNRHVWRRVLSVIVAYYLIIPAHWSKICRGDFFRNPSNSFATKAHCTEISTSTPEHDRWLLLMPTIGNIKTSEIRISSFVWCIFVKWKTYLKVCWWWL